MKKRLYSVFIIFATLVLAVVSFFAIRNSRVVEYYLNTGSDAGRGADIQFVLRRNRKLTATFGIRNEKNRREFDKSDFFEEVLSEKEVVITEEDYEKLIENVNILAKEDVRFEQEMFSSVHDWILPIIVYKGKNYVGDGTSYEGKNEKQCERAAVEIMRILIDNAYPNNPYI